jgi:hypothetical protein
MKTLDDYLNHCIRMAQIDKVYSWSAANTYAKMYPELLESLPEKLTERMRQLQQFNGQKTEQGEKWKSEPYFLRW